MSRIAVKVCGITEERDAVEAAHLGADAVGFHFWADSPRYVDPEAARRIGERLPVFVTRVGVFRDAPLIRVLEAARTAGVSVVQFDGEEAPGLLAGVAPLACLKTLRFDASFDPETLGAYPCRTFLLRAPRAADREASPWPRARALSLWGDIVIGGPGLDASSVATAIDDARPRAVDILEGAEFVPGKKDLDRLEAVIEAVRRAERRIRDAGGR